MEKLCWIGVVVLMLFVYDSYANKPVSISSPTVQEKVISYSRLYEDKTARLTLSEILEIDKNKWEQQGAENINWPLSSGNFWFEFKVENPSESPRRIYLCLDNYTYDRIVFHTLDEQDSLLTHSMTMGDYYPYERREFPHPFFIYEIDIPPGGEYSIYTMVGKNYGKIMYVPRLFDDSSLFQFLYRRQAINISIIGLSFIIGFLALFSFLFERNRYLFWYGCYALSFGFLFLSITGMGFQYLWPSHVLFTQISTVFFGTLHHLVYPLLVLYFFKIKKKSALGRTLRIICYSQVLSLLLMMGMYVLRYYRIYPASYDVSVAFWMSTFIVASINVAHIATLIACIWYWWQERSSDMMYFLLSKFVYILSAFYILVLWLGWQSIDFPIHYPIAMGWIAHVIVLLVVISRRHQKSISERQLLATQLAEKKNEALGNLLVGQEAERERLAQELHDGLGVRLLGLYRRMEKMIAEKSGDGLPEVMEEIHRVKEDVRHFSHALNPTVLQDLGLEKALDELIFNLELVHDEIDFNIDFETGITLSKNQEKHLYHIVSELLNNTIKYTQSNKVSIEIKKMGNQVFLFYFDNGQSYDFDRGMLNGSGLKNIRSRLEIMNGLFQYEDSPEGGKTHIIAFDGK